MISLFVFWGVISALGYWLLRILQYSRKEGFLLMYPIGLALLGSILSQVWFWTDFFIPTVWLSFYLGLFLFPFLILELIKERKLFLDNLKHLLQEVLHVNISIFELPWVVLSTAVLFSFAILTLWSWNVYPIHWDSVALYEYRAIGLSQNWSISDFTLSGSQMTQLHFYEWHHPWFLSILGGMASVWGVENTSPMLWLLLIHTLLIVLSLWKSWQPRLLFLALLFLNPAFFDIFIQGYAIIPAGLFLLLTYAETTKQSILTPQKAVLFTLFVLASLQNRIAEPYWIPLVLWILWQYRKQWLWAFIPVGGILSWVFEWTALVKHIHTLFAFNTIENHPAKTFLTETTAGFPLLTPELILSVARDWLLLPATVLAGVLIAFFWVTPSVRKFPHYKELLGLLCAQLSILLTGMCVFAFTNPPGWQDIRLALPRASFALTLLGMFLLCHLFDTFLQKGDIKKRRR